MNAQPVSLQFGFAHAMDKLVVGELTTRLPIAEPGRIEVDAARGEVAGVQVRILAGEDFILTVDRANWLHALGFRRRVRLAVDFPTLPAGGVEVLPVGYLEGDDRRLWMEPLLRSGFVEGAAWRPQAVWLRLRVPAGLAAGEYSGRVTAFTQIGFEDEVHCWEGEVVLRVHAVTLPPVRDWSYHLDLWQHFTQLARHHGVALWSDEHFVLIDRYCASLAELGQKAVTVVVSEIPWSGQRGYRTIDYPAYLFEHTMVEVRRDRAGMLHCDFAHLDRLLAIAATHGIDREIEIFGLINIWTDEEFGFGQVVTDAPDAVRVRCVDETTGAITYLRQAAELTLFMRALHDHLAALGVLERVRILADEPADLALFEARLAFVQQAAPGFLYKVAINHFEFIEHALAGVVDAVPVLPLACQDVALTQRLTAQLHAAGGRMLWYVCCWPPLPNTFLHSPLVEGELLGWLTHALGMDGFLRWAFCLWPADPWRRASWRYPLFPAGDMWFVLPGPDGWPVETVRYEAMRMAAQDFELLKLVERTLSPDVARTVIDQAMQHILRASSLEAFVGVAQVPPVPADTLYSLAPEDYQAARRVLLSALGSVSCG